MHTLCFTETTTESPTTTEIATSTQELTTNKNSTPDDVISPSQNSTDDPEVTDAPVDPVHTVVPFVFKIRKVPRDTEDSKAAYCNKKLGICVGVPVAAVVLCCCLVVAGTAYRQRKEQNKNDKQIAMHNPENGFDTQSGSTDLTHQTIDKETKD